MCGILQCEERDTVTAFSYFLEVAKFSIIVSFDLVENVF